MAIDFPIAQTQCGPVGMPFCFQAPLGGELCLPDTNGWFRQILSFLKGALGPLNSAQPFIKVLQILADIGKIIEDLIGVPTPPPLNVGQAASDAVNLVKDLGQVLTLSFPPAAYALALIGYLKAIRLLLIQLRARIVALVADQARILASLQVAQAQNNTAWLQILTNAQCNTQVDAARIFNQLAVLASLFRLINSVLCLLKLGPLVPLTITPNLGDMLVPIDATIALLNQILALIPNVPSLGLNSC